MKVSKAKLLNFLQEHAQSNNKDLRTKIEICS